MRAGALLKKKDPGGRCKAVLQLFCGRESSAADKNSAGKLFFPIRIQETYFTAGRFRILKVFGHPATK